VSAALSHRYALRMSVPPITLQELGTTARPTQTSTRGMASASCLVGAADPRASGRDQAKMIDWADRPIPILPTS
jgi:hypothetical protein